MGRGKSKKLAGRAASATATAGDSSSGLVASRASPNLLLPSSKDADTTKATTSPIPCSSEGPTLPIIGGEDGFIAAVAPKPGNRALKKRRLANGDAQQTSAANDEVVGNENKHQRAALEPLYEPWTLLPPALQKSIEARIAPLGDCLLPVVFTKNQSIKSGINKLKSYLGAYPPSDFAPLSIQDKLGKDGFTMAVSAQGEAATKLVGIVEMTKRVVKPSGVDEEGRVEEWYMYTSLSSRVVEKDRRKGLGKGGKDGGEEEEAFETVLDIQEKDMEKQRSEKTVPVLTVWMSKQRIPAFRDVLGEQIFRVLDRRGRG